MQPIGYPLFLQHPAPGAENPMNPALIPIERELTIAKINGAGSFEFYNYITAEDDDGVGYYVAKPWMLRVAVHDGQTYTIGVNDVTLASASAKSMTASAAGEDDETWVITPDYFEDEVITVRRKDTGITTDEHNSDDILWEDINTAGRCWAAE